jgi:CRP-like cAMP-binding protein
VVNTVVPGRVLGLTGFLRRTPHTTSARAASDAVVFALPRSVFEATVGSRPGEPAAT